MKRPWTFLLTLAFLQAYYPNMEAQTILTFRIGASVGQNGVCAPLYNDIVLGYQYFFNWLARKPNTIVTAVSGKQYVPRLQLRLISHNCTEEGRAAAMSSLINGTQADPVSGAPAEPPVHLLLGGNGDNAMEDALQAEAASRILLHCCTARDTVFHLGLSHVYGLFTPASMYTGTVLRTMALRGMRRVAVVYSRESLLHVQLCEGALAQLPSLAELRPGFSGVLAVNYSATEADTPGFWNDLSAQVVSAGADVLIACDGMNRSSLLVHQLRNRRYQLSALWLASWGNITDFLEYLDGRGEYALTTVQWMPNLPYADTDFGTAAEYAAAVADVTGQKPSYFSAAATASGYVLLKALRQAISMCSLSNVTTAGDMADAFMWSEGALSCVDQSQRALDITGRSGTAILRYVLGTLNMDTFFGPVGFNAHRQNNLHPVIVTQVLSSDLVTVLPLDAADKALVMPIPWDEPSQAPEPWATTPAGISIITAVCCLGLVCVALALFMCTRVIAPQVMTGRTVEIGMEDIQVDIPPQINADGSCEPGEGVYRGTRVKLVVANELLQLGYGATAGGGSRQMRERGVSAAAVVQLCGSLVDERVLHASPLFSNLVAARISRDSKVLPYRLQPQPASNVAEDGHLCSQAQLAIELTEAPVAAAAVGGGGGGITTSFAATTSNGYKKRSESILCSSSVSTTTGQALPPSAGSHVARLLTMAPSSCLGKRSRRQILALVWRAVRLQHPRMCPVLGIVWEWPGLLEGGGKVPVVVRQWHEFDSLDRLLENETVPLPLMTKANIMLGVAEGLAYLHTQEPPIFAGPMDASRVIIDKNFNPHLFLRLRNLDPGYSAGPSTTGTSLVHPRALRLFATQRNLSDRLVYPPQRSATVSQQASPLVMIRRDNPCQTPSAVQSCVTLSVAAAQAVPPALHDVRQQQQSTAGCNGGEVLGARGSSVGNGGASGNGDKLIAQTSQERPTPSGRAGTAAAFLSASGGLASMGTPPALYQPSREQDVYEFGRLLCSIFMLSSPADSGWLRFALHFSNLTGSEGDYDGNDGFMGLGPSLSQPPLPSTSVAPPIDDYSTPAVLSHLESICPALAEVAKACLHRESGLTFTAIAHMLEVRVIPSLAGGGVISCEASRSNVLPAEGSIAACKGSWGSGATLGKAADSTGIAQSVPATVDNRVEPRTVQGSSSSVTMVKGNRAPLTKLTQEDLIYELFPPKVARALQAGETVQPERYECVSIFFSDVVGYTDLCSQLQPFEVMDLVHRLYSQFDDLIRDLRLFKVETVGDAYLAVANLRWPQHDDHARLMTQFAFAAVRAANSLLIHPERPELGTVHIRVGLHCGPVVGSVVGTLNRRYCLFGDAVNTAARMEHNSKSDCINCSAMFAALLREQWPQGPRIASRGSMVVKGKGAMELFWLEEGASLGP